MNKRPVFGVLRRRNPVLNGLRELVGGHARVRRGDDREDALCTSGSHTLHVAFEQRRKRLSRLPLRMLRRERLDAIEREDELKRHRLLGPERPVVVERGNPLRWLHKVLSALLRDTSNEVDDRLLGRAVVPGWQGINGRCGRG